MLLPQFLQHRSRAFALLLSMAIAVIIVGVIGAIVIFTSKPNVIQQSAANMDVTSNVIPIGVYMPPTQQQGSMSSLPANESDTANKHNSSKGAASAAKQTKALGVATPMTGIYESSAPRDPESLKRLEEIRQAGFNTVINYNILNGSKSDIVRYLDKAQSLGLYILFSINDFYDIQENPDITLSDFAEYGTTNDQVVTGIVKAFKSHPALYGWYISDEQPDAPEGVAKWASTLQNRYQLIKRLDPIHPTVIILSCYQGSNIAAWPNALKQLSQSTDGLGFDSYPVPYEPTSIVGQCSQVITNAVPNPANRWFVIQSFSWATYPDVVAGDNQDISKARYPSLAEMKTMITAAKKAGVPNILMYSYFDLKNDPANFPVVWQNIKQALIDTK